MAVTAHRPLIVHIVFSFDYGGMENGLVNLINRLPADRFEHAIIALSNVSEFRNRLQRDDVRMFALGKRPGNDLGVYARLWRLLRQLRPAIVHTRNWGTFDCNVIAWLAGVPARVHGEHGWDVHDPDGANRRHQQVRRLLGPLLRRFITVSEDLRRYLVDRVGIDTRRVTHICNGVDTERFHPRATSTEAAVAAAAAVEARAQCGFPVASFPPGCLVIGTVSRFSAIKDPQNLVRAFIELHATLGQTLPLRLCMIGDGPLRADCLRILAENGLAEHAWLPGARDDIPELLRAMDLFVLGSLREGISNTILEAMASGLPVIATRTGGNPELIIDGQTGSLVPVGDASALAEALATYVRTPALRQRAAQQARQAAVDEYSLATMTQRYLDVYKQLSAPEVTR